MTQITSATELHNKIQCQELTRSASPIGCEVVVLMSEADGLPWRWAPLWHFKRMARGKMKQSNGKSSSDQNQQSVIRMTNQGLMARWFVKCYLKRWILNFLTNGGFYSLIPFWATYHIQMPAASSIGCKPFTEFRRHTTFKQPCKIQACNSRSIKKRTNTDF